MLTGSRGAKRLALADCGTRAYWSWKKEVKRQIIVQTKFRIHEYWRRRIDERDFDHPSSPGVYGSEKA